MRLVLALAAAGAVVAALNAPVHADDDGLPLPARPQQPVQLPPPEAVIAVLESRVAAYDAAEARVEKKIRALRTPGMRGALGGEHDANALVEIFGEDAARRYQRAVDREVARLESSDAVLQAQESVARGQIGEVKAKVAADEAARAAEAQARADQAALGSRVEQAIANAKNAWRSDGIVNQNTGGHSWDMWCLALASTAWATAVGHPIDVLCKDSAYHAYLACADAGLVHAEGDPPRGALVFWPAGSSGFGHVAIANGDGTVVSNYNRRYAPTGINEAAPITDFGQPIGWVDPRDLK